MRLQVVIGGEVYDVEVEDAEEDAAGYLTPPPAPPIQSAVVLTVPMPGSSAKEDDGKLHRSPVSGLVTQVKVEPGQQVNAGEPMLVLEAMKMETYIVATRAGKVKSVAIAGAAVKVNEVLVEFE